MNLSAALGVIVPLMQEALIVHANGFISRESFNLDDRAGNFYMIGSMGLASSIGLGIALNVPNRRVVVLDGDGNVLMNMGSLALIGAQRPANFLHVVLDNEAYGSTGNQRTITDRVALEKIAEASGYINVRRAGSLGELQNSVQDLLSMDGPSFLLAKISVDQEPRDIGRIVHEPKEIARRFMKNVGKMDER